MTTQITNGADGVRFVGLQAPRFSSGGKHGETIYLDDAQRQLVDWQAVAQALIPPAPPAPADPYGIEERKRRRRG